MIGTLHFKDTHITIVMTNSMCYIADMFKLCQNVVGNCRCRVRHPQKSWGMATVTIVCSANETLKGYVRICIAGCQKPCSNVFVSKNTGVASYRPVKNTFYLKVSPSCRESEMLNFIQSSPLPFFVFMFYFVAQSVWYVFQNKSFGKYSFWKSTSSPASVHLSLHWFYMGKYLYK